MKKIVSLLMVVAIVLTMSIAAMAAPSAGTMKTTIVETDSDITAVVTVDNANAMSGAVVYLKFTSNLTYVKGTWAAGKDVAEWGTPTVNENDAYIKAQFTVGTNTALSRSGSNIEVFTVKLQKSAEISNADIVYGTGYTDQSKVTDALGTANSKTNPTYFTVEYVDERTNAGGGEVGGNDSFDATEEDVNDNWDAKFDYKDATGTVQENAVYTGKKVVAFGKAATDLSAEAYGVQIGNRTYKGLLDVSAGEYFAIIVINTASDAAILNSYKYQVWTGSEDAPEYKTEKLDAYIAQ